MLRSLTPSDVHNVQTWSLSNVIFPFDFVLLLLLFIQSFTLVETELCSARRGDTRMPGGPVSVADRLKQCQKLRRAQCSRSRWASPLCFFPEVLNLQGESRL